MPALQETPPHTNTKRISNHDASNKLIAAAQLANELSPSHAIGRSGPMGSAEKRRVAVASLLSDEGLLALHITKAGNSCKSEGVLALLPQDAVHDKEKHVITKVTAIIPSSIAAHQLSFLFSKSEKQIQRAPAPRPLKVVIHKMKANRRRTAYGVHSLVSLLVLQRC